MQQHRSGQMCLDKSEGPSRSTYSTHNIHKVRVGDREHVRESERETPTTNVIPTKPSLPEDTDKKPPIQSPNCDGGNKESAGNARSIGPHGEKEVHDECYAQCCQRKGT